MTTSLIFSFILWSFIVGNLVTITLTAYHSCRQGMLSHPYLFHWVMMSIVGWTGVLLKFYLLVSYPPNTLGIVHWKSSCCCLYYRISTLVFCSTCYYYFGQSTSWRGALRLQ